MRFSGTMETRNAELKGFNGWKNAEPPQAETHAEGAREKGTAVASQWDMMAIAKQANELSLYS